MRWLRHFLNNSKVVSENKLTNVAYVVDIASEHLIAGVGDKLYVNGLTQPENQAYSIYRKGEPFIAQIALMYWVMIFNILPTLLSKILLIRPP